MLAVYGEIATAVRAGSDRDDAVTTALYDAYRAAAGNTVRVAAEHIRAFPRRFVQPP